jgi:hypothetical protein
MRRIRGGLIDTAQPGTLIVFNETVMAFCGDQAFDLDRFDALISDPGDSPLRVPPGTDTLVIEVIAIQR